MRVELITKREGVGGGDEEGGGFYVAVTDGDG